MDTPAVSPGRKGFTLATCCLSVLIAAMDGTIVNVAIPSIRDDFGASAASTQWVVAAYALTMASVLLLSGAAGDRYCLEHEWWRGPAAVLSLGRGSKALSVSSWKRCGP